MRTFMLVLTLALVGCSGGDKDSSDGEDSGEPGDDLEPNLFFEQTNNYSFGGSVIFDAVAVAPQSDLTFDWSAMTTDIRGRPMTPDEVEQVLFVEFALTQGEVTKKVEENSINQGDSTQQWIYENTSGGSTALASQFEILASPFDVDALTVNSDRSWLASLVSFPSDRMDIRSSIFVVPTDGETNTTVAFTDDSAQLDFTADLSAPGIEASASDTQFVLSWDGITVDSSGASFDSLLGDSLIVGKMATNDLSEVEGVFLRLFEEAETIYRLDVYGKTVADLTEAVSDGGDNFSGFTEDGIWLVAIECTTCISPAPLILSVVDVSP